MSYQALLFCQDEKTARTVTQVLNELEFQVDPCVETFAAVKKLTSQAFEAVVVDCQNEENASLLLKTARNSVSNQASLMVALVEGQAGVAAAFRIGANLVLTKPIAVEQARGTLRVARGLLRKNTGGAAPVASAAQAAVPANPIAANPAPAAVVVKPVPAMPTAPMRAPAAAASITTPAPAWQKAPQVPVVPRVATSGPVPPSALRAVASSSNLETEAEIQPHLDAAAAGLLESLDSKVYESTPSRSFGPNTSEIVSVSEIETGANQAVRAALTSKAPMSSQEFGAGFGAAAAAPAKEQPKALSASATPGMSAQVADLFEAPVFGQTIAPTASEPATQEPEIDLSGSPAPSRSKMPLVAVAAVLALAGALYFGWAQFHKPVVTNAPVQGPLQPPPPDFGTAEPTPQTPPPAQAHAATPVVPDAAPTESVNRFSKQNRAIAEDRVTTPIAVVTPSAPAAVRPSGPSPIQVKTEAQHSQSSAAPDVTEAPSIAGLGAASKPAALNAIASSTASMPVSGPQRISQGVSEGLVLKRVPPVYPSQALQMHVQGMVTLQAMIGKDGSVRNVKVVSGPALLARAAQDAVRQWKYKPYTLNGDPIEVQTEVNINFKPPQ